MATLMDKIKMDLIPAIVSGGISLVGYQVFFGGDDLKAEATFLNTDIPVWALLGGATAASHLVGKVFENQVATYFETQTASSMQSSLYLPVISGLTNYGIYLLGVGGDISFIPTFGIGAGSVVVGEYVSRNILGY